MIVFVINTLFMNDNQKKELQSAAFERLLKHLDERKDVQNIDLMNLAGFCRNCLSRWYREESIKLNLDISDKEAREKIYGMPYDCLLYTSPSPRDLSTSRMPSSA